MIINIASVLHSVESLVVSKVGGAIVAAILAHWAHFKLTVAKWEANVKAAEAKVLGEIKAKFDAAIADIHAAAEHDELAVKATIAKVEADIRKIF